MLHKSTAASISTRFLLLALTLISPIGFASQYTNADIDGDAIVSSQDISKLASCFGQNPASNNDCAKADVDEDGDIDVDDFSFVSSRLGQAYPWMLFPSPTYNAGSNPGSMVLGDVNKDAVLDAVLISSGGLSVLLGNGDGSFQIPRHFTTGDGSSSLALGDVNGNGMLDVVVANAESNDVSVLLGNGEGGFQAQRRFAAGNAPVSLALGDMNEDGALDVVVANRSNDISVLLGNGEGGFQAPSHFAVSNTSGPLTLGDVNGDGALDAVIMTTTTECAVSMLLGNGDGSFQAPRPITVFDDCSEKKLLFATLDDVNRDGTLDMLFIESYWGDNYSIYYLSGNGNGNFQEPQWIGSGSYGATVALGDMNGDDTPDVVVASGNQYYSKASVIVEETIRSGDTLSSGQWNEYHTGSDVSSLSLGDLNGDGTLDVVVVSGSANDIFVLLGNGDGTLQGPWFYYDEGYGHSFLSVNDVNGDGMADVVKVINDNSNDYTIVWQSNGDGSFQTQQLFVSDQRIDLLALGDVNGDGVLDAVAISSGSVLVFLNNGDGDFQAPRRFSDNRDWHVWSLALGDMNGDSVLDMVLNSNEGVVVLQGNGDGSFQAPRRVATVGEPSSLFLGDVNNDGVLDAVVSLWDSFSVLLGNGEGGFQDPRNFHPILLFYWSLSLGEVNGDGALDIMISDYYGNVWLMLGNGDGSFQDQQRFVVGECSMLGTGDVNGDGLLDVVFRYVDFSQSNDSFSALLNRGRVR